MCRRNSKRRPDASFSSKESDCISLMHRRIIAAACLRFTFARGDIRAALLAASQSFCESRCISPAHGFLARFSCGSSMIDDARAFCCCFALHLLSAMLTATRRQRYRSRATFCGFSAAWPNYILSSSSKNVLNILRQFCGISCRCRFSFPPLLYIYALIIATVNAIKYLRAASPD